MPNHDLNQCWRIDNSNIRNTFQYTRYQNSYILIQENAFENVVYEMAPILSRPQVSLAAPQNVVLLRLMQRFATIDVISEVQVTVMYQGIYLEENLYLVNIYDVNKIHVYTNAWGSIENDIFVFLKKYFIERLYYLHHAKCSYLCFL